MVEEGGMALVVVGEFCLGVRRVRVHDMGDEWEEDTGRWADVRAIEERGSAMLCT